MAGRPAEQRPSDWSNLPSTNRLISEMLTHQEFQNAEKSDIIKTKRGKGGGIDDSAANSFKQCRNICSESGKRVNRVFE